MAKYTDRIALTMDVGEAPRLREILDKGQNLAQLEQTCLVASGKLAFGPIDESVERVQIGDEWLRFSWLVCG